MKVRRLNQALVRQQQRKNAKHPASKLEWLTLRRTQFHYMASFQTTNKIPVLKFLRLWTAKKFRFNNQ